MLRSGKTNVQRDETPTLSERLVMAILAPIFFNVSLLICLSVLFRRSRFLAKIATYETLASGWCWLAILIVIPAIAGYRLGSERCATLLGHFFYTNMEHEKHLGKTALSWGSLILIAYLISKALPHH